MWNYEVDTFLLKFVMDQLKDLIERKSLRLKIEIMGVSMKG